MHVHNRYIIGLQCQSSKSRPVELVRESFQLLRESSNSREKCVMQVMSRSFALKRIVLLAH